MPCQWNPDRECQFVALTNELFEHEGRTYCRLHLPFAEGKPPAGTVADEFRNFQERHGVTDFSGVWFPGEPGEGNAATYYVIRNVQLHGCTFGERARVIVEAARCDLTGARFLGANYIQLGGHNHDLLCLGVTFTGDLRFEASGCTGRVNLAGSTFHGQSLFNTVDSLMALNFAGCNRLLAARESSLREPVSKV